jgi:peptide/nickel transport system substrate-binding protein
MRGGPGLAGQAAFAGGREATEEGRDASGDGPARRIPDGGAPVGVPTCHRSALAMAFAGALIAGAAGAQEIAVGVQLEPPHLDPTSAAAGAIDQVTYQNVYEGLTRFAEDGSIVPSLARDWEVSEDGTVYTFALEEGVSFHDGTTMDAEDVVFSLDRARAEDSVNAQKGLFEGIASVEALDPATVRVTLSEPDGAFPFKMAWGDAVIVAPESADGLTQAPIGTGAFRFEDWVQGDRIVLARNEDYWGEPAALERTTFRFVSDPSAAFAAVMSEDLDAFLGFPAPENLVQFEADPRFAVQVGTTEGETILAMNHRREPLADPRVREAIALAVDRQALIDGAMFGYGTPIGTHFAPHHPAYVDLTGETPHDPEAARALLAGLEVPTLSLKLPPPSYARRGGEILAAQLREVGIETEIENLEWAQWLEQVFTGHDYDLTIVAHTEPLDIGIYADPGYYFGYDSAEVQDIMARLAATPDEAGRAALLQDAQRAVAEDHVNAYLFQLASLNVVREGVEGIWPDAPTQAADLTAVTVPD